MTTSDLRKILKEIDGLTRGLPDHLREVRRCVMRGAFRSIDDLKAAINRFVAQNNADPKLFIWTADPRRCQTRETSVRVGPLASNLWMRTAVGRGCGYQAAAADSSSKLAGKSPTRSRDEAE